MNALNVGVIALSLFFLSPIVCVSGAASAKASAKKATTKSSSVKSVKTSPDQVITKNPDGTVEVTDAPATEAVGGSPSQPQGRQTIYRLAPAGTTKYADGTIVKRNADGSVEVMDSDSVSPVIHWDTPAKSAVRPAVRSRAKTKRQH